MITRENYEEYMLLHADGELASHEEQELMAFVNEHPELKKELALYDLTRSTPDTAQVFAGKESLLKPLPGKRTVAFPRWRRYRIAAGIAALVFITLFKYATTERNNNTVAKTDTVKKEIPHVIPAPVKERQVATTNNVAERAPKNTIAKVALHAAPRISKVVAIAVNPGKKTITGRDKVIAPLPEVNTINSLPLAQAKKLPPVADKIILREIKDIPQYAVHENENMNKKTFWEKLPIDDIKKKQLENIAGAAVDAYNNINTAKQNLYEKSVTIDVKVQKRKLVISF